MNNSCDADVLGYPRAAIGEAGTPGPLSRASHKTPAVAATRPRFTSSTSRRPRDRSGPDWRNPDPPSYAGLVDAAIDRGALRHGQVRGRYFRENFAQAGIDLVQIIPELVTNADAAIAAADRARGRIHLRFGPPDPLFAQRWKREVRRLRVPALAEWKHEIVCFDDGEG